MPWRTPDLVTIREEFVVQAMSGRHPVAALCNAYGISEKTGHKWINRFKEEGRPGLSDRSRAPHESPRRISLDVRKEILALREKHPTWGPKKLCELLSVWWIRLGIRPERIEPGEPQQNGTHERMHKTLKADATRPPSSSLGEQQIRFDRFRREYNDERPHESLGQTTPASCYSPSTRAFPSRLPDLVYPAHCEVRVVTQSGAINFGARRFQISTALTNQELGLEEIDDGMWTVNFGPLLLGTLHYPSSTFIDEVRWKDADTPPEEDKKARTPPATTTEDLPMSPV